ncbi:MAG TPA: hypothetical protein VGL70_21655 [Candidatus Binatia bacterium]|jgi:hypothetical protein
METVLAVLGQPQGRGKSYLPGQGLFDVWDYFFAVATAGDVKQKYLLVFFDNNRRVQGYIWWSDF